LATSAPEFLNTVEAWTQRTIAEVGTWDDPMPSEEKNERGLEKIRHFPVETPVEPLREAARAQDSQTRT
jgi:hypothetical protein